jgi:hypothetical protein
MISDFSSEVGVGDTHSTFSDDVVFQHHPGGFGGGFTHHSSYAGILYLVAVEVSSRLVVGDLDSGQRRAEEEG